MSEKYEIIYSPSSMQDIRNILDYVSMDNPSAAKGLIDKFNKNIESLSSFPLLGSLPKDKHLQAKKYRLLIVDNYIIFYILANNSKTIKIARVLSNKQNYKYML